MQDFLEVDKQIPGQNFVCLSFISPEKVIKNKELFFLQQFLQETYGVNNEKVLEEYQSYIEKNEKTLEETYSKENNFVTSVRGLKVRGVYDTLQEAQSRAQNLQKNDPSFHVFVGSVGYWLPWDPSADAVSDQVYQEEALNQLMSKYKENEYKRDMYYQQQKEEMKQKAVEENLKKKSLFEGKNHHEFKEGER
jgi:hypothetical protein